MIQELVSTGEIDEAIPDAMELAGYKAGLQNACRLKLLAQ
jgi:hypothetical protein